MSKINKILKKSINIKNIKHGFTLMEVMIVMALIGILAAIAFPQYTNYVVRAHRAIGMNVLQANLLAVEQFRTQTGAYPNATQVANNSVTGYMAVSETGTPRHYTYQYQLTNNSPIITMNSADVDGEPSDKKCATMILNANGTQSAESSTSENTTTDCWQNRS